VVTVVDPRKLKSTDPADFTSKTTNEALADESRPDGGSVSEVRTSGRDLLHSRELFSIATLLFAVVGLVVSFLMPLQKYSWMNDPELSRVIDPDTLLLALFAAVAAALLSGISALLSRRGRIVASVVLALSILQCGRLGYIYIFNAELIWYQ
jgi:hypothetical protein